MSDIFDEAEDGLRQERWTTIAKKSAPWVGGALGIALIAALGFWGYSSWEESKSHKASELYVAAAETLEKGDMKAARADFQKVADAGSSAYKALALSQIGGIAVEEGKTDEAVKLFGEAANASSSPLVKDMAELKAAFLLMEKAPYADIEKRLTPLTKDGRPYAALAREALALAKIQSGDVKGARGDLQALSYSLDASEALKQRAQMTVALIDSGGIEAARAAIKLPEVEAPPQPVMPMQMPAQ